MSTPIPESLIACAGIALPVSMCIFFGVTVAPVVLVLFESGRDVRGFGADMWESEVTEVDVVVALGSSGLSLEPESDGRMSPLERECEREEERERKP